MDFTKDKYSTPKIGPNRQCCLAGSSKMAPRILIFSIAMGANHSFYVKSIETNACAFLPLNISAIDTVIWAGRAEQQALVMLSTPARKKAQEKLIAYCSNTYTVH